MKKITIRVKMTVPDDYNLDNKGADELLDEMYEPWSKVNYESAEIMNIMDFSK